jgi:succinoglycan biosynthesis transport protein ExoP
LNHQKINAPLYTSSPVVRSEDHESPLGAKEEQSLDLSKVIAFFQRKWRSITLIFLFSLALAAIYLLVTPAQYTATSLLMLDTRRLQLLQQQSLLSELSFDAPAVESQLEVLKSEAIALSVINKLDLVNDPEYSGGAKSLLGSLISTIRGNETSRNEPPLASVRQQPVQQALRSFSNNLSVQRIGRSYVISISFQSLDASKASRIANAVGEAYIQDQLQVIT